MINITYKALLNLAVNNIINITTMSVEQTVGPKQTIEQQVMNVAAQGVRMAKLVLLRSTVLLARDVATPENLADLIPIQRQSEVPPLEVEIEIRRDKVLESCRRAFDFAIQSDMDSEETYIRSIAGGPYKSEYIGVESPKHNPLTLHRPTIFNEGAKRYSFWLSEKVETSETNLSLPSHYYRDIGIDAQGNFEEKIYVDEAKAEYRILDIYESLPYYRALTPIKIQKMVMTETSSPAES
jgi:hypothetical protein